MARIFKGALLSGASGGHVGGLGLMIPDLCLGEPVSETEEIPDSWVIYLTHDGAVAAGGREARLPYLSEEGYSANITELWGAYAIAPRRCDAYGGGPGSELDREKRKGVFHEHAMRFYASVKEKTLKKWKRMQEKADELKKAYEALTKQ